MNKLLITYAITLLLPFSSTTITRTHTYGGGYVRQIFSISTPSNSYFAFLKSGGTNIEILNAWDTVAGMGTTFLDHDTGTGNILYITPITGEASILIVKAFEITHINFSTGAAV